MNKKIGSIPQLYIRHCYALPSDYAYVAPVVIKKEKTMSKKCGCFPVCLHEKDIYRFQMSPEERTEILELIESYIDHLKDDPSFCTGQKIIFGKKN